MTKRYFGAIVCALITSIVVLICITSFVKKFVYLPKLVILLCFLGIAIVIIGYPIYALAKWSDRYLKLRQQTRK